MKKKKVFNGEDRSGKQGSNPMEQASDAMKM